MHNKSIPYADIFLEFIKVRSQLSIGTDEYAKCSFNETVTLKQDNEHILDAEHREYCASCIPCDWLYIYNMHISVGKSASKIVTLAA